MGEGTAFVLPGLPGGEVIEDGDESASAGGLEVLDGLTSDRAADHLHPGGSHV